MRTSRRALLASSGLLEMTRIAAMARVDGIEVAPHNPSGPVATAANVPHPV